MEDDSSDEEETTAAPIRKRKVADSLSMKSGRTRTSRYTAGGKGIHRPVAASFKSRHKCYSVQTTASMYSTKKAQGDMKKKGKLDPYAYIPLSRYVLKKELLTPLATLANRYDTQNSLRIHIEHSIISAIKSMGPECVLKTIPLTNAKGEVLLEKSWILPLLREGATGATFKFFKDVILPLALDCNTKWNKNTQEKNVSLSHTYELLCCQRFGEDVIDIYL